jgi:hypothetical protein
VQLCELCDRALPPEGGCGCWTLGDPCGAISAFGNSGFDDLSASRNRRAGRVIASVAAGDVRSWRRIAVPAA